MAAKQIGALADIDDRSLAVMDLLIKEINRAGPKSRGELRRRIKAEIEDPLAAKIRSAANGPHGRLAASTVKTTGGSKPAIWLGRGSGLAAEVAFGAEFGGQKPAKVRHIMTSRTRAALHDPEAHHDAVQKASGPARVLDGADHA